MLLATYAPKTCLVFFYSDCVQFLPWLILPQSLDASGSLAQMAYVGDKLGSRSGELLLKDHSSQTQLNKMEIDLISR
jgi:hypothetical protein